MKNLCIIFLITIVVSSCTKPMVDSGPVPASNTPVAGLYTVYKYSGSTIILYTIKVEPADSSKNVLMTVSEPYNFKFKASVGSPVESEGGRQYMSISNQTVLPGISIEGTRYLGGSSGTFENTCANFCMSFQIYKDSSGTRTTLNLGGQRYPTKP